jgi:hypothetical protein
MVLLDDRQHIKGLVAKIAVSMLNDERKETLLLFFGWSLVLKAEIMGMRADLQQCKRSWEIGDDLDEDLIREEGYVFVLH